MYITRMRYERIKKDWTQAFVGQQVGLTKTAVHDIEIGKQKPSYDVMCKLENLFLLSHRQLFEFVDPHATKKA